MHITNDLDSNRQKNTILFDMLIDWLLNIGRDLWYMYK